MKEMWLTSDNHHNTIYKRKDRKPVKEKVSKQTNIILYFNGVILKTERVYLFVSVLDSRYIIRSLRGYHLQNTK